MGLGMEEWIRRPRAHAGLAMPQCDVGEWEQEKSDLWGFGSGDASALVRPSWLAASTSASASAAAAAAAAAGEEPKRSDRDGSDETNQAKATRRKKNRAESDAAQAIARTTENSPKAGG